LLLVTEDKLAEVFMQPLCRS